MAGCRYACGVYGPVDVAGKKAHDEHVHPMAAALRAICGDLGLTQETLGDAVGRSQVTASRWLGREPLMNVDKIRAVEAALKLPRGLLLRTAGYVADATTIPEMIEADPTLTPENRRVVLRAYEGAVQDSAETRRSRSAKRRPTARKTDRS